MDDLIGSISNWLLTALTGLAVWMFKQIQSKQSIAEAREMENRLTARIEEQAKIIERQQVFLLENVATKKDIENLRTDFQNLSAKFDSFILNIARENGAKGR